MNLRAVHGEREAHEQELSYILKGERLLRIDARVEPSPDGGVTGWLALRGSLCPVTVGVFDDGIRWAASLGAREVHVDLTALEFCDAAGLGAWESARSWLGERGARLLIHNAEGVVRRVIDITDFPEA